MILRSHFVLILSAVVFSQIGAAQFAGTGGIGGFGGDRGFGGIGGAASSTGRPGKAQWRPWLSISGSYIDNPIYIDEQGSLVTTDARGVGGGWGVSMNKSLERTAIQASYVGNLTTGTGKSGISGMNQILTLGVSHRFNKNFFGSIQELIGSTLGGYGAGSGFAGLGSGIGGFGQLQGSGASGLPGFGDPSINGFVDDEAFANRVNFNGTSGSVGYQLSLRSSVSISGGAQFARRQQSSLSDTNSYFGGLVL